MLQPEVIVCLGATAAQSILGPQVRITAPELPWETVGFRVNEGPAVLIRHGRVFTGRSAWTRDSDLLARSLCSGI